MVDATDRTGRNRRNVDVSAWPPLVILVIATAISARGLSDGGFRYPDEARHAVSGILLMDMIREGGWLNPKEFGEQYYCRYPALSIPFHAPPLFHAIEGFFFTIFGVSTATARHAILFFHLGSVLLLFEISRREFDTLTASIAALAFATYPMVVFWSRHVVLEPPAVFMILLASLFLLLYLESPTFARAIPWFLAVLACLFTKQTAVFVIPAHLAVLWIHRRNQRRRLFLLAGVFFVIVAGYIWFWYRHSPYQFSAITEGTFLARTSYRSLFYYPYILSRATGWWMLALAFLGILVCLATRPREVDTVFLLLAGTFYLMMLSQGRQTPRYVYPWTPMVAFFAARALAWLAGWFSRQWMKTALLAAALGPNVVSAFTTPSGLVDGYEQAALEVAKLPGGASILIDGFWDGDFVFFCRQHDLHDRLVLRGSKVLYTFASYVWRGFTSFVRTPEDIERVLRDYGVRYLVLENIEQDGTEPGQLLRRTVEGPPFRLVKRLPIEIRGDMEIRARYLDVYEYLDATEPTADALEMEFPGLNKKIRVPLRHL